MTVSQMILDWLKSTNVVAVTSVFSVTILPFGPLADMDCLTRNIARVPTKDALNNS